MAGHSKWANIKHRKGAQDAKRAKMFTRISKEIMIAVKEGNDPDPNNNPRLRLAIQNARGINMPKDNIQRAIDKASDKSTDQLAEMTFEGHGPGGVGIFVECMTDNNNRTVSDVRSIFNKRGGSLGKNGSLSFIFERKGVFTIPKKADLNLEELELELIDAGAEEFDSEGEMLIVTTSMEDFGNMQKKLDELNIEAENAGLQRIPNSTQEVDLATAKKVLAMVEEFEENDDVQNVYHNLEMTPELEKELS
ncbi:putative transcriptional regulatory protein YebC [Salinivirga cyanobacteriivorans]|uniref:Probable transcriptional regulatory protein L21SP5_01283 n=1 Tax=Salinivirga cyanobacteriivorans TaxID=1307839 RepID=A0A0S2HXV3_9BACT|nr:YebC/PmpR family DNA-binding transcriptional regulator [Salinivirga cyanobacteriivorans]ALO14937.1 putative transcriptional regulatory protein YebC [Salinivirga cyanobacteriivorans]